MNHSENFINRLQIAEQAENRMMAYCLYHGIPARKTGAEFWLPKWIHQAIKPISGDPYANLLKHFPDIATPKALIQVKSAPDEAKYAGVTIEKDSLAGSLILSKYAPVLLVYMYQDGTLHGGWVNDLQPRDGTPVNGSHTPMVIIEKSQLHPIDTFKENLC